MRSIAIAIILIVLVVGGVLIYQRDAATSIGDTLRSVKESSQDAATTSKVKTALMLSKHVSAFEVKASTNRGRGDLDRRGSQRGDAPARGRHHPGHLRRDRGPQQPHGQSGGPRQSGRGAARRSRRGSRDQDAGDRPARPEPGAQGPDAGGPGEQEGGHAGRGGGHARRRSGPPSRSRSRCPGCRAWPASSRWPMRRPSRRAPTTSWPGGSSSSSTRPGRSRSRACRSARRTAPSP